MELLKGQIGTVTFPIPDEVNVTVNVLREGVSIPSFTVTPDEDSKQVDVRIPYAATHEEGTFNVTASFTYEGKTYTNQEQVSVVTPYLQLWELKTILETEDETLCWVVESAVRSVINAHCGQEFGSTEEPQTAIGNKESTLAVNRPVIKLDRLTEDGEDKYNIATTYGSGQWLGKGDYKVIGDGWYIKRPEYNVNTIKSDSAPRYSSNPIRVPRLFSDNQFRNDSEYVLYGRFGYDQVPFEVKEAAKLLVNDYACADSMYRDRYLKSIRSADWSMSFASGAWLATGNARADALLVPWVVNRIVVI